MRLRNLNLAPRAALFFTSIIVLVFVLGVFAVLQMGKLRDAEKDVELNWMASIRQTALMNTTILRLRLETQRGLADPQSIQKTIESFAGYRKAFTEAVANYEPLIADEKERSFYIPVKNSADAYAKQLDILEPLMRQGDIAAAVSLVSTSIRPLTNTMEVQIKDLTNFNNEGAARAGQTATDLYENGLWLVVGLIAGVVILTVGLALLLTKSITSPINDALSVAERIAASDLSKEVLVSGTDEAERLLKALAQMQANLRNTIMQISDSSTQLASASEEMTAVTEESSRGLVSQNDEVNQAATAVTEMSAAVDEVARNAESASEESKRTQGYTEVGLARVAQTLKSIQKLNGNVENTSEQIQGLSDRAQSITKVVEVIRAIAEQTNLLALNAAIEAARAGEQGRGFAVVADEVRALAHRTQVSTQEIEQMIAAIQSDSDLAVKAMNTSRDLATESLGVAQEASTSLDQISTAIIQINERNLMIATASEEQSHVAREVDRNLVSIRELTTQSAAGAAQTASACGEMSKLAVNLNQLVNRFVV
ncbi:Methyl-accepting chemotaxis protein [Pseudomonas amygdali pv. myricae]|uniref:methyl-accepting chemotaxis protein n=1 Tax=Pseudomonas amygdali TaxID=47877 RepID=UPI0006B94CFE|nr:methyl-accepting chemotaxis protein [Pseudomonas amygdali]KPB60061.1 Methyl-accepting chemotaxis protein [Pseudomonas amygdali pv. myricae]KPX93410.1 Methyl-accepting chemotaxis protein [Pseudomonas amygdali pv. myricae]KWS51102.1 chemotaxis protein [Pseudomonas amygdali pv. myricae]RMT46103.1 Methyl-accepting chemotaxis protein [Pseudomonas amygdali pv. myricae]RMV05118.1 Histidine kinase, HAMP region:Bacterial chemotaxis sensory transducer [Pseudomonas amygdali pv. myricae]